jgi:hypothetical protein
MLAASVCPLCVMCGKQVLGKDEPPLLSPIIIGYIQPYLISFLRFFFTLHLVIVIYSVKY